MPKNKMLLSTFIIDLRLISCIKPSIANPNAKSIGTSPNQSVIVYNAILVPVKLCTNSFSVENPTFDSFGPIGDTSIVEINAVQNMNAIIKTIDT